VISVTLGVATMIVVNAVMSGFTTEMQKRIHGILSDVVVESRSLNGFPNAEWHMDRLRGVAGEAIAGMTATVVVPAMLSFQIGEEWITRQIQLIGVDPQTHSQVSDFARYLQHPANRRGPLEFRLHESGYDTHDHQAQGTGPERKAMEIAGWNYRRRVAAFRRLQRQLHGAESAPALAPGGEPSPAGAIHGATVQEGATPRDWFGAPTENSAAGKPRFGHLPALPEDRGVSASGAQEGVVEDPFSAYRSSQQEEYFDMATQQHTGAILGIALGCDRRADAQGRCVDRFFLLPGDDVVISFPNAADPRAGGRLTIIHETFTIVDFYESKMAEYDASFVFVPLEALQISRGMFDRATGVRYVNAIQIKLKPGYDCSEIRDRIQEAFPVEFYIVSTWQDKQGALLAAVRMETAILNILLFLIIAVAGFGILAIFLMIVVEKTRDIGILKALGASSWGIQAIFMGYGLTLGFVGSGFGLVLGLLFVRYINEIADWLGSLTGRPLFDPEIYYFYRIPTIVEPSTVAWIVFGAVAIAVLASIVPAIRAARLRPVESLRYE